LDLQNTKIKGTKWNFQKNKKKKVKKVLAEYQKGALKSSSGAKITDKSQALAIGYSEGRRAAKKK